jgi:hypothetical protein
VQYRAIPYNELLRMLYSGDKPFKSENSHATRDFLKIGLNILYTSLKPGEMLNDVIFHISTCGSVTHFLVLIRLCILFMIVLDVRKLSRNKAVCDTSKAQLVLGLGVSQW